MSSVDVDRSSFALIVREPLIRVLGGFVAGLLLTAPLPSAAENTDWSKVAAALGKPGTEMPGGVYRVGLPRTDLHVTLDGVELKPGLALGSWLAFRPEDNTTMVMGDLVLTETEIAPVMSKLAESGIEITALHNHLLRAQPATLYMHVLGHGDPGAVAGVVEIEGGVISGLRNEPESAPRRRRRLHHGED